MEEVSGRAGVTLPASNGMTVATMQRICAAVRGYFYYFCNHLHTCCSYIFSFNVILIEITVKNS